MFGQHTVVFPCFDTHEYECKYKDDVSTAGPFGGEATRNVQTDVRAASVSREVSQTDGLRAGE